MSEVLIALLDDREAGRVERARGGRLSFTYNDDWRTLRSALPLSLSMPLAAGEHGHEPIEAFLWGLLPDNELVLSRWAKRFQVSAKNAFALVSRVGEDCAGAFQFVRPERLEDLLEPRGPEVEWIDEAEVAERLRDLRRDPSAWRSPRDTGQFSLAGGQPKVALFYRSRSSVAIRAGVGPPSFWYALGARS